MKSGILGALAATTILSLVGGGASAQRVDIQKINNLRSQQTSIENRIEGLQRQVDDAYAGKVYCTPEERQEDLTKLRALRQEIAGLRKEYAQFRAGFIKLAANPVAGPQFDAAGIHPDERGYWTADDIALQKLSDSSLTKANRVEQATLRDCNEKTPAPPATSPPPSKPPTGEPTPPPPSKAPPPPKPPKTAPAPPRECTENEGVERRLRIQDEILRLEGELIPLDGTKPGDRARQLELTREIDRLKPFLNRDCPPLLPPLKPASPPRQAHPQTSPIPTNKIGTPATPFPRPKLPSLNPLRGPLDDLEDDAEDALDDLDDAMDHCNEVAVEALIPELEHLSREAHAVAAAARAAGELALVRASEAQAMADDLDEAIAAARKFKCVVKPGKPYRDLPIFLPPIDQRILYIHDQEREAVHVPDLKWNFKLEWNATGYASELGRTHVLVHAPREGRGIERENLLQALPGWSADRMMQSWTMEKRDFRAGYFPDVAIDGNWLNVAHYTQMIWPTTTEIGCGYAVGGGYGWLVCRYSPGGNKDGKPVGLPYGPERG